MGLKRFDAASCAIFLMNVLSVDIWKANICPENAKLMDTEHRSHPDKSSRIEFEIVVQCTGN